MRHPGHSDDVKRGDLKLQFGLHLARRRASVAECILAPQPRPASPLRLRLPVR